MDKQKLPIGFWLIKVDKLLTEGINKIHSEYGITRHHWQIINFIYENPAIDKQALILVMEQFADSSLVDDILKNLKLRDIIAGEDSFDLTHAGKNLHSGCLKRQIKFREKAMTGISEQEYDQVLLTLEKMVANLSEGV